MSAVDTVRRCLVRITGRHRSTATLHSARNPDACQCWACADRRDAAAAIRLLDDSEPHACDSRLVHDPAVPFS